MLDYLHSPMSRFSQASRDNRGTEGDLLGDCSHGGHPCGARWLLEPLPWLLTRVLFQAVLLPWPRGDRPTWGWSEGQSKAHLWRGPGRL